jgi:HD-like signal output (HDOD) protein
MADLAGVIRDDQTIAMSIMKLANSAVYGGLDEIKELNTACARLGMRNIANTVQMVANNNLYVTGDARLKNFMRKLWRHSVATAHCASEIAILIAEPRSEMLFLAGLVQNVGKVVLLDIITGQYSGAIGKLRVTPEVLKEVIENFQALLGMHVVQQWNMPPEFVAATYFQTHPGDCPREDWLSIVHIVSLASLIATVEGYGLYEVEDKYLSTNNSARYLSMNDIKLASLRVDLQDKLQALFDSVPQAD